MSDLIPTWWEFVLLALAAYRLTRLGGWDEFPLAARARAWVIGERWIVQPTLAERVLQSIESDPPVPGGIRPGPGTGHTPVEDDEPRASLPGKQPTSEADAVEPAYDRPTLAHLIHCPFCLGWWMSLAVYLAFLAAPSWTLVILAPLAISGAVGLVAKNLDA